MSKTNAGTGEASDRTERFFFQVGFQRCGTTAIAAFFERCGIPAVHCDEGRLAKRMRVNIEAGTRPLAGYDERYRAFTSMNWSAADDYYDAFKHYGGGRVVWAFACAARFTAMIRSAVVTRVRSLAARGLAAGLLAAVAALLALPLQAVTLVNNLSQATTANTVVGGDNNVRQAQKFTVPTGQDYSLDDVTITVSTRSTDGIVVSIHDGSAADPPGTALYTLIDPASPGTGNQVYSAPAGAVLEGGNSYFVMLQRAQDTRTSNTVSGTSADVQSGETGWSIADIRRERSGATWSDDTNVLKIRIRGDVYTNAAPTFDDGTSTTREFLNESIGTATADTVTRTDIGQPVAATDTDTGDTLEYTLSGTDAAKFTIDTTNGQIRDKGGENYDYEAKASYAVTVTVMDGNGGSDTIAVTLNLLDQDEPPLAPDPPVVTGPSGNSQTSLILTLTRPGNAGRPGITGYAVRGKRAGFSWTELPYNSNLVRTIVSLTSGKRYEFQVRARNNEGEGPWSASGYGDTKSTASGEPDITGTARVGQTLTAGTSGISDGNGKSKAENGDPGFAYTYQWVRRHDMSDTDLDITGETASTYTLTAADLGNKVKVKVSFTDNAGYSEGPLTSDAYPSSGSVREACDGVWCATLNVTTLNGNHLGCANSQSGNACSNPSRLTEDEFTHASTSYSVTSVQDRSNGQLQLWINPDITSASLKLVLHVGTDTFNFQDADTKGANNRYWNNAGLSWSSGGAVELKLSEAPAATDATLSGLALVNNNGATITLTPGFLTGTKSYTAMAAMGVSSITLTPTVNEPNATVAYLNASDAAITDTDTSTPALDAPLVVGENTFKVKVTAEDTMTTDTYTVVVTRAASNTAATGTPSIDGTPQVGMVLTAAKGTLTDADGTTKADNGDTGYAYSYQWVRVDGSTDSPITGATASTYTPVAADVGKTVKVTVSFTDDGGTGEARTSNETVAVLAAAGACPSDNDWCTTLTVEFQQQSPSVHYYGYADSISLGALGDRTINYGGKTWTLNALYITDDAGTRTIKVDIPIADGFLPRGSVFTLGGQDFTATATAEISATITYEWPAPAGMAWIDGQAVTVSVELANFAATGEPAISGTAQVGETLTAGIGDIADTDGLPATFPDDYTFQWLRRDGGTDSPITGATASTYTPVAADVGKTVKVTVSFTDDGGTGEARTSNETVAVVAAAGACPTDNDWCTTLTVEFRQQSPSVQYYGYIENFGTGALGDRTINYGGRNWRLDALYIRDDAGTRTIRIEDFFTNGFLPRGSVFNLGGQDFTTNAAAEDFATKVYEWPVPAGMAWIDGQAVTVSVTLANFAATGKPAISGTAAVGETLTAAIGNIADTDGLPATFPDDYTFEWLRRDGGTDSTITGATASTYTPVAADVGKKVKVTVSFTDDGGTGEARTSNAYPSSGTIVLVPLPALSFDLTLVLVDEDAGSATLTVELDPASTGTVTVDYATRDRVGGATAGDDYTATSGTLTFAATETSKTITVPITDDDVYENNESFDVDLSNPTGATLPDPPSATVRIVSEDAVPTASMADVTADEGAGTMTLTLRLSHLSHEDIAYVTSAGNVTGTATEGDDYDDFLLEPGGTASITVPGGSLSHTFDITLVDDGMAEPDETIIIVWRKSITDDVSPTTFTFTGTITAVPLPVLSISGITVDEDAGTATLTVELTPASTGTVTVDYATRDQVGGATAGDDYTATSGTLTFTAGQTSKTITVPITDDDIYENYEAFFVDLSNPTGATVPVFPTAAVGIDSEDAVPTASMADVTVDEGAGTMTLILRLNHPSHEDIAYSTVDTRVTGTATEGEDYDDFLMGPPEGTARITVPGGSLSQTFDITIVDDGVDEADETIVILWQKVTGDEVTPTTFTFTGTIVPLPLPALSFASNAVTVDEDAGSATHTVELTPASTGTVTVDFATRDHDAKAGEDYTATSGTLTFTAGQTSKTITVPILNDDVYEAPGLTGEIFFINISNPTGATLPDPPFAGVIIDSEEAVPTASMADVTVDEGAGTMTLILRLSHPSQEDIAYFTREDDVTGTATEGEDYDDFLQETGRIARITVPAFNLSHTFDITLVDDGVDEPDETIIIVWQKSTTDMVTPITFTFTGTIVPEPLPALSFDSNEVLVDEDAGSATLTVELDPASTGTVTVDYATRDSFAKAGEDYTATSGTLTFTAGQTSKTFTVPITDDDVYENNEAFFVDLSNPTGATLPDPPLAAVRIDSEEAAPTASMADVTVDEGAGTMTLTLRLSHPSDAEIAYFTIYDEDIATGTATEGEDYDDFLLGSARTARITVPAGDLSQTFDITLVDDGVDEPDETIVIEWIRNSNDDATPDFIIFTGTITDNDTADNNPTVRFGASSYTAIEGVAGAVVTVELNPAAARAVTILVTATPQGGASSADYSGVPGSVTFAAGETEQSFTVTATDDSVDDDGESVQLGFGRLPSGVLLGSPSTATVALVQDADVSTWYVWFGESAYTATEGGSATIGVHLNSPWKPELNEALTVPLFDPEHQGGASADDYSGLPESVTFQPGQTRASFTVRVTEDSEDDDGESVLIGFRRLFPDDLEVGRYGPHKTTLRIADNDGEKAVTVSFAAANYTAAEGGATATVRLRLDAAPGRSVTIELTKTHRGATAADYSGLPDNVTFGASETEKSFTVTATDDSQDDDRESVAIGFGSLPSKVSAGSPSEAVVQLTDNDHAVPSVQVRFDASAGAVRDGVEEGGSYRLGVRLSVKPGVTLTIPLKYAYLGGATAADFSNLPANVTFAKNVTSAGVTIRPVDDFEEDPGESLKVSFGTLPAGVSVNPWSGRSTIIPVIDNDATPGLSVSDASAREWPNKKVCLIFKVTMDLMDVDHEVSVDYATASGTAVAGQDFKPISGTLVFRPSESRRRTASKSLCVEVIDDSHDEGLEEMTLVLSNPVRAYLADGTGTGFISNTDKMPGAWLTRFGRAATDHVVEAVGERWQGGHQTPHLTLGGRQAGDLLGWAGLGGRSGFGGRSGRDTAVDRDDPVGADPSSMGWLAPSGGAGAGIGATAPGMTLGDMSTAPGGPGGVEREAGKTLSGRAAQGALLRALGLPDPRAVPDLRTLLMGSSFFYSAALDEDGESRSSGRTRSPDRTRSPGWLGEWSAWGRTAASRFSGADGNLALDGEVATAMLGFDSRWDRWLAGVVVSFSEGRGAYTHPTASGGAVASTMTGLNPYARFELNERTSFWGVLGYGAGDLSLTPARSDTALGTELANAMAAFGGRTALSVRTGEAGRFELALRSDARLTNTVSESIEGLVGTAGQTARVRLMLEGSGSMRLATGGVLKPKLEAGLRYDTGDAETGAGLEVGGGFGYATGRLSVEVNARGLLAHRDTEYEEWGFSGSIAYTPSADGRGLSMRLGSAWGATQSGVQSLWSRQDASGLVRNAAFDAAQRYQVELRYGLDGKKGRARWEPYMGVESGEGSSRALRLGVKLTSGRRLDAGLELGQRQGRPGADPEQAVQLRGALRW